MGDLIKACPPGPDPTKGTAVHYVDGHGACRGAVIIECFGNQRRSLYLVHEEDEPIVPVVEPDPDRRPNTWHQSPARLSVRELRAGEVPNCSTDIAPGTPTQHGRR